MGVSPMSTTGVPPVKEPNKQGQAQRAPAGMALRLMGGTPTGQAPMLRCTVPFARANATHGIGVEAASRPAGPR
jgi:hypothetical protein